MELNQLQYFCTLARVKHFTRAADEIHISQSTLSRAITRLEEELGVALFIRGKRSTNLTEVGEQFFPHVMRALQEIESAQAELVHSGQTEESLINLSFLHSQGICVLPSLLHEFHSLYPGIRFRLEENNSYTLAEQLLSSSCDLCLCSMMMNMEQLAWLYLYTEEIFAVLPIDHPLAASKSLKLSELADNPFITLKPRYSTRILSEQFFSLAGIRPNIIFEGDDINTVASLVAAHLGVSLLPKCNLESIKGLSFVHITSPVCKRDIGIAWNSCHPLSPAALLLQQFIIRKFTKSVK